MPNMYKLPAPQNILPFPEFIFLIYISCPSPMPGFSFRCPRHVVTLPSPRKINGSST